VCLELWIVRSCVQAAKPPKGSQRRGRDLARSSAAETVNEGV
jgi:hypothetical protein